MKQIIEISLIWLCLTMIIPETIQNENHSKISKEKLQVEKSNSDPGGGG
ncbi:hypothetical protein [Bacillus thuringiensis]|nr:hypothetical protein [Bacillus thuringiensis]